MAGDDPKPSAPKDNGYEDLYNDPFDGFGGFTDEDLINIMSDLNPNLMDMSFTEHTSPPVFPTLPLDVDDTQLLHELDLSITNYDIKDEFDSLSCVDDGFTISLDMYDQPNDDLNDYNDVPGEIGNDNGKSIVDESTRLEVSTRVFGGANGPDFDIGGSSTMPVPVTPTISDGVHVCGCCKMLRELVHLKKEVERNTLNIFGGIGFFCHAVLLTELLFPDSMERQPQTIHLQGLTMEEVKKFIEDYCSHRVASGLSLVRDTNAAFYQAMSANFISNQSTPMLTIPSPTDVPMSLVSPEEARPVPPAPPHVGLREQSTTKLPKQREKRKTPLAAQRERTKQMTLKDICQLFDLPIEQAAKEMKVCVTVLKKICRKGSLRRWPHRKIKSLQAKIEALKTLLLTATDGVVKARAEAEIERLQRHIDKICSDILKNM
ncbi:unnamed protein product [Arabidopsis arenosa]|uniref:RWP-RK domain-containing protein n=1 Tax=Arabidopsis arenosa TaxID=38785 RepID=A0A8S2AJX5_ARAAE|nr:unnamed protein product [Arabidopsis arenosa]